MLGLGMNRNYHILELVRLRLLVIHFSGLIEGLHSDETRNYYANEIIWKKGGQGMTKLKPHAYETASLAYRGLAIEGQDQSILVSGESGAVIVAVTYSRSSSK